MQEISQSRRWPSPIEYNPLGVRRRIEEYHRDILSAAMSKAPGHLPSHPSKFSKPEQQQLLKLREENDSDWFTGGNQKTYNTIAEEMNSIDIDKTQTRWTPQDVFEELKDDFACTKFYNRIKAPQANDSEVPGTAFYPFEREGASSTWQPTLRTSQNAAKL